MIHISNFVLSFASQQALIFIHGITIANPLLVIMKLSDQNACVDDQTHQRKEDAAKEEATSQFLHLLLFPRFLKRLKLLLTHLSYLLLACLFPTDLLHLYNFLSYLRYSLEFIGEKSHEQ